MEALGLAAIQRQLGKLNENLHGQPLGDRERKTAQGICLSATLSKPLVS